MGELVSTAFSKSVKKAGREAGIGRGLLSTGIRGGEEGGPPDEEEVRGWREGIGVEWVDGLNREADELARVRGVLVRWSGGGVRRDALAWDDGEEGSDEDPLEEAEDRRDEPDEVDHCSC